MQKNEIETQIKQMSHQEIGGFFIHSRAGLTIKYMSEQFFERIQFAIDCADKYDIDVWLYDENGWPSGFGGGEVLCGVDYYAKKLVFSEKEISKENYVKIAAYKKNGDSYSLSSGEGDIYAYYEYDRFYVDLLSDKVTEKFIESTHEVYKQHFSKYFGKRVKGIFTDEPQLKTATTWSCCLESEFFSMHGYSLIENLYLLYTPLQKEENIFRYHYFQTVSRLYNKNFTQKISNWCSENNLIFTGHFPCEDGICHQYEVTGGVMKNYRYMRQPGIDFLGRRLTSKVLLKQIQSVKNQMGYMSVLSETFGCSGWNVSFRELANIWAYQSSMGINLPCLHLSAYSIKGLRKRDYPSFFSYQQPWWDKFGYLSKWINNINEINSNGKPICDVLVLSPIEGVGLYPFFSTNQRKISNQFRMTVENLCDCQIDFDLGDSEIIDSYAKVENGVLRINEQIYTTVIVPDCKNITSSNLQVVYEFKKSGGVVVFTNDFPQLVDGRPYDSLLEKFISLFENQQEYVIVQNRADLWRKYFEAIRYKRAVYAVSTYDNKQVTGLSLNIRECGEYLQCHICNPSSSNYLSFNLIFAGQGSVVSCDILSLNETIVQSILTKDGTICKIVMPAMSSKILRLYKSKQLQANNSELISCEKLSLSDCKINNMNSCLLDSADCSYLGKRIIGMQPTRICKLLHAEAEKLNCPIDYEMTAFFVDEYSGKLYANIESECVSSVLINGESISDDGHWFIDKSIKRFDLSTKYRKGLNNICIKGIVHPTQLDFDIETAHESQKNKFFHSAQLENIYLTGDFDVSICGVICQHTNYISVENADFKLISPSLKVCSSDLTLQGLPFYRGSVSYFAKVKGSLLKTFISCNSFDGVFVEVLVDNMLIGILMFENHELDISQYAKEDIDIELRVYSSNRNILGPHHHISGEPNFVGVSTFNGERGYEDYMMTPNPNQITHTENYNFVPFGKCDIWINRYK